MSGTDILQLSNFYAFTGTDFMSLLAYLQENLFTEPGALLVSGLTREGTAEEFEQARVNLESLANLLNVKPDQIMILPSIADLKGGYTNFDIVFETIMGWRYAYEKSQIVSVGGGSLTCQFFGIDTTIYQTHPITEFQFITRLAHANECLPTSPRIVRIAFYHDPFDLFDNWAVKKACRDHQVRLGLHGEVYHRAFLRDCTMLGVGEYRFNYLRLTPSLRRATAFICAKGKKRWKEPASIDIDLKPLGGCHE